MDEAAGDSDLDKTVPAAYILTKSGSNQFLVSNLILIISFYASITFCLIQTRAIRRLEHALA